MKLEEITDFLNASGIHQFNPISFPSSSSDSISIVNITGGTVSRGGVYKVNLRILTRESHPSVAINKSHEVRTHLYENLKGVIFGGKKVLGIETNTPEPLPLGEENGLYTVSWNYVILEG